MSADQSIEPEAQRPPATPEKKKTIMEILQDHVKGASALYKEVLESDIRDERRSADLTRVAEDRLKVHLTELDVLNDLLARITRGERFRLVVQRRESTPRRGGNFETFRARLAPDAEKIPIVGAGVQNQLSLYAAAAVPESVSDALYSASLGQSPDRALAQFFRMASEQRIEINIVGAYIDAETDRVRIQPQAGISFSLMRGEDEARVGGLTYIGNTPHHAELFGRRIPKADFVDIQKNTMMLSQPRPQSGSNRPTR